MDDLHNKNILVTGGTGFVGRALCDALAASGAHVIVLSRRARSPQGAIRTISRLEDVGADIDIIINLAGEPIAQRWTKAAKDKIRNSRIDTTAAVVQYMSACRKKPDLFISGSAIGYYGTDEDTLFEESTPPGDGGPFSRQLCADWESEATKAEALGVRTVFLRIGAVMERDGGMLAKLLMPFRLGLGGRVGSGEQSLSWIDRDDLIRLILHIIRTPALRGPVNATSPHPVSNDEFSHALADALHRPCLFPVPGFVLRLIFGDMPGEIMLAGQRVFPRKAIESGFTFLYPRIEASLEKALEAPSATMR